MHPSRSAIKALLSRHSYRLARSLLHGGSYGLNGIDRRLIEMINPNPRGGYYVELGANDGLRQSNTYLLQWKYGWGGLLIEPSPARFLECVRNRSFGRQPVFRCAACVDPAYTSPFVEMEYSDLMSVALGLDLSREEARRQAERGLPFLENSAHRHRFGAVALTLTALLEQAGAPADLDLLSLDVEGNELAVLRGLDLERYRPRWILAECRDDAVPRHLEVAGYRQRELLSDSDSYRDILFRSE
ncbi:FkbM family methyltransferase [Synechococcus sp. CCY 9618]|uniref:FkbM family methyltransferase n=1 Tax=Synechococcus sp. CCY 9618 TaxID=2815602 RepID=UPI001C22462A|nr:FkbM family methyltransferase [Synechococcus sp. CCY 9618]